MTSSSSSMNADDYPSLLWITLPPIFLVGAYYVRKWYLARRLRLYGIGKGAKGFQTNVQRVRVTPEIAARIRRGEDVSPAEIEAASRAADEREAREGSAVKTSSPGAHVGGLPRGVIEERDDRHLNGVAPSPSTSVKGDNSANEWLPESITKPSKRKKSRR
ncbi:hypothetical protein JR316_0010203 [Psilocybe cubensis]|uniref:Uncharacterized protein n=2 Tax=Psilocybe cubensis TaxID=181762 RepID=A0A8H7XS88_PSICU|nr:hypothetical protein JR316_0010203 [Psilocybe cubensis]KAH9477970.1 hypothetical protein JR316_0010203 [Psilocybe cubensis]